MSVKTLSQKELHQLALKLLQQVQNDRFTPDIVIGVATGGVYISRPIHQQLTQEQWQGAYHEITLQRPSTKKKSQLNLKRLFAYLPYPLLDLLRLLESRLLHLLKPQKYNPQKESEIVLSQKIIADIQQANTLLLIDDAIDSGTTLLALCNRIKKINPNLTIKTAVLTCTQPTPYIEADYKMFDQILLRCPWADDYKGEDHIV
jgi:hypoxanthine phosphoribosyltransferase